MVRHEPRAGCRVGKERTRAAAVAAEQEYVGVCVSTSRHLELAATHARDVEKRRARLEGGDALCLRGSSRTTSSDVGGETVGAGIKPVAHLEQQPRRPHRRSLAWSRRAKGGLGVDVIESELLTGP